MVIYWIKLGQLGLTCPAGQPVTRTTRVRPGVFFSNVEFETHQYIYFMFKKKIMFFQYEIKKAFWFKYFNLKR